MADEVDRACVHSIATLDGNLQTNEIEWACLDCGRVFASINAEKVAMNPNELVVWSARHGIPDRTVNRFLIRNV